jgi:hypothetical protein
VKCFKIFGFSLEPAYFSQVARRFVLFKVSRAALFLRFRFDEPQTPRPCALPGFNIAFDFFAG